MVLNYTQFNRKSTIFWIFLMVDSKDGVDFAMLFTLRESRRTSDPVLSRDRGKILQLHPVTPCSEALRLLHRQGYQTDGIFARSDQRIAREGFGWLSGLAGIGWNWAFYCPKVLMQRWDLYIFYSSESTEFIGFISSFICSPGVENIQRMRDSYRRRG